MTVGELIIKAIVDPKGLKTGMKEVRSEIGQTDAVAKKHASTMESLSDRMGKVYFATQGLKTLYSGWKSTITTLTTAHNELVASQRQLEATAKLTNVPLSFLQQNADKARDSFKLSKEQSNQFTIELTKLATKAGGIQKTGDAMGSLLDLAAARGLNAQQALTAIGQAILGIDEGTDKLFGKNPSAIYDEWAKSAGTTAGKMTDMQKSQALLDALLADGAKVQGEYSKYLESSAGKADQAAQASRELTQSLGQLLNAALGPILPVITAFVRSIVNLPTGFRVLIGIIGLTTGALITLNATGMMPLIISAIPRLIALVRVLSGVLMGMGGPVGIIAGVVAILSSLAFAHRAAAKDAEEHQEKEAQLAQTLSLMSISKLREEISKYDKDIVGLQETIRDLRKEVDRPGLGEGLRPPGAVRRGLGSTGKTKEDEQIESFKLKLDNLIAERQKIQAELEQRFALMEALKTNAVNGTTDAVKGQLELLKETLDQAKAAAKELERFKVVGKARRPGQSLDTFAKDYLDLNLEREIPGGLVPEQPEVQAQGSDETWAMIQNFLNMKKESEQTTLFLQEGFERFFNAFSSGIKGMQVNWGEFMKQFLIDMALMAVKTAIFNAIFPGAGSAGGGMNIGSLFKGSQPSLAMAGGGNLAKATSAINSINKPGGQLILENRISGSEFYVKNVLPSQDNLSKRRF